MNLNKALLILIGIGISLGFLASYLKSNSPIDMYFISIGIMAIILGFYNENKRVNLPLSYFVAIISINITQWLILIYILCSNSITTDFYIILIGSLLITSSIINQIHKKYLKSPENSQKRKINFSSDKTKLILLFAGVILIISGLIGFIYSQTPIFPYLITLGMMAFIYGFYHEGKKVNVSRKYAGIMCFLLVLQGIILIYFVYQFSQYDWVIAVFISVNIAIYFSKQINRSNLNISNEKKEMIIGIFGITLFIAIFGAYFLFGYNNDQPTIVRSTGGSFDNQWIAFNYPANWTIVDGSSNKHVNIYIYNGQNNQIGSIKDEDVSIKEYSDLKTNKTIIDKREVIYLNYATAYIFLTNSSSLHVYVPSEDKENFYQIINSLKIKN